MHHVAQYHRFTIRIGQRKIQNFLQVFFICIRKFYPNHVFITAVSKKAGRCTGKCSLEHFSDFGYRQFHIRSLLPIHDDQFFRGSRFAAYFDIGNPVDILHHFLDAPGQRIGYFQVVAANFHLHFIPFRRSDPQQKKPLSGPGANQDAGKKLKFSTKISRNLLAGPLALCYRLQCDAHRSGIGSACPPARSSDKRHRILDLRHFLLDDGFNFLKGIIHHIQLGTHRHFGIDPHLAFIRGRHHLNTHQWDE